MALTIAAIGLLSVGGLWSPSTASAQTDPAAAFARALRPPDMALMADAALSYEQAFPQLARVEVFAERRGFAGAHGLRFRSLRSSLSLRVFVVDLSDAATADLALNEPKSVTFTTPAPGAPKVQRTEERDGWGSYRYSGRTRNGRFLVIVSATAADSAGAVRETRAAVDSVLNDVDSVRTAADLDPPEDVGFTAPISLTFSFGVVIYLLAVLVRVVGDRTFWQRAVGPVRRLFHTLREVPVGPGTLHVDVRRTARRRRLVALGATVIWATAWAFAAILLAVLVLALVTRPLVALPVLVVLVGLYFGVRALARKLMESARRARDYRRAFAAPRGVRAVLWTFQVVCVGLVVATLLITGLLDWFSELLLDTSESTGVGGFTAFAALCAVLAIWALVLPREELLRGSRIGLDKVVSDDQQNRPPVLFLRSFADDQLRVRTRRGPRHSLIERLALRRRDRFEETVAWSLWSHGPVVACAEPGRRAPSLGAARDYLPMEGWETAIQTLMVNSSLVAFELGPTPGPSGSGAGFWHEVSMWQHHLPDAAALFLIPPTKRGEREASARLAYLASYLGWSLPSIDQQPGVQVVLAVAVDQAGNRTVITGSVRDDVSYEAAIELGAQRAGRVPAVALPLPPPQPAPGPSSVRRAGSIAVRLLPFAGLITLSWLSLVGGLVRLHEVAAPLRHELAGPTPVGYNPGVDGPSPRSGVGFAKTVVLSFDANGDVQQADFSESNSGTGRMQLDMDITSAAIGAEFVVAADLDSDRVTFWPVAAMERRRTVPTDDPIDVAVAGDQIVAVDANDGQVQVINADGTERQVSVPGRPFAAASSGSRVFVVTDEGSIVSFDAATGAASSEIDVCVGAHDVMVDAGSLVVACELEQRVERYSLNGELQESVDVPLSPAAVVQAFDGWIVTDALVPQIALFDGETVDRVILDEIATSAAGVQENVFLTRWSHDRVDAFTESELRSFPLHVRLDRCDEGSDHGSDHGFG